MEIKLIFETEKTNIDECIWEKCFEEFKKIIKNYIIQSYNDWNYEKAEVGKDILSLLYFLEKNKEKKSWHHL